ncbi:MAG: hypothetical protein ABI210_07515 [Abditibacteriaceae bacterium]
MSETNIPQSASLFLEDFVVTQLLRKGKSLKSSELTSATEGFHLSHGALHEALKDNPLVVLENREWTLRIRLEKRDQTKEERERQPMEATVGELLSALGKPLPVPVIAREVSIMRDIWRPNMPQLVLGALHAARQITEVSPDVFLHGQYTLELDRAISSDEEAQRIIAENHLDNFPKFKQLSAITFADPAAIEQNALQLLRAAQTPVPRNVITFLLWKQHSAPFDYPKVLLVLADRKIFHSLTAGLLTSVDQMPTWRNSFLNWARNLSGGALASIDVATILRQRKPQSDTDVAPRDVDIEEIKSFARDARVTVDLPTLLTEALELEADDPQFIPTLIAVNDQLRGDSDFITAGVGKFLLRELVPPYITHVPEELRPVQLPVNDPITNEPLDFEMSDDGLEGDASDFVHDPQWGDVGEEVEVKFVPSKQAAHDEVRYIILAHHHRAGTLKLRRSDEEFFGISGPITRLNIQTSEGDMEAWASRESSLISGLGDWFTPQTPISGGVIRFYKTDGTLQAEIAESDPMTHISEDRAEQLERLRGGANYMSLYEVLQNIMHEHQNGMELPGLWAEVNLVRRTAKRLLVSVLCGYHCFYFKQRGSQQILWRLDKDKVDQGFKRNKRKYVRR